MRWVRRCGDEVDGATVRVMRKCGELHDILVHKVQNPRVLP